MSERTAAPRETKGPPLVASGAGGLSLRAPANAVPPGVHEVLRSPGRPLDAEARAFMEPRLGFDFSRVRVHSDAEAAASASAVKALAYTFGHHVVFGAGHYVPRSADGQRLLAHELTHVVQQTGGAPSSALVIGQPDRFELAADRAADAVTAGKADLEPLGSGEKLPEIQRQPAGPRDLTLPPSPEYTLRLSSLGSLTVADFALDKADLPEAQVSLLAVHAKIILSLLHSDPLATVVVTGHTDASGSEKHNLALGLQRAEAAKRALVAAGVLASGITTKSAGESQPIVATQAHEPGNRRVEIRFEPSPQSPPGMGPKAGPPGILPPLSLDGTPPPLTIPPPGSLAQFTPEWLKNQPSWPPIDRDVPPRLTMPPLKPSKEWLQNALEADPFLRLLPKELRKLTIDGLKDADEAAADKIVDALPSNPNNEMLRATLKAFLKLVKGKKFIPPTPPPYPTPEFRPYQFPEAPGEKIFKLPPIKF